MNHVNKKYGFTIIELMLAMGFVSALLLAIAMTVIQIGNIYNKGITYKSVNQAGSSLASELQRSINGSSQFDLDNNHYIAKDWGGRLCIGQYSYIWNYGTALNSGVSNLNVYSIENAPKLNFIKVIDPNGYYCSLATSDYLKVDIDDSIELLDVDESNLAIHSFLIDSNAYDSSTQQRLYNIRFQIGTNDQTTLSGTFDGVECKLANEKDSDPTYCAVNIFDIIARAGNNIVN